MAFIHAHHIGQDKKETDVARGLVEERIIEVAKREMMLTHLVVSIVNNSVTGSNLSV